MRRKSLKTAFFDCKTRAPLEHFIIHSSFKYRVGHVDQHTYSINDFLSSFEVVFEAYIQALHALRGNFEMK